MLVTDISVRKRSERERDLLMAELEQKNKELETLVYVASHDLRSPLVNIQGFSQRLGRSLELLEGQLDAGGSMDDLRAAALPLLKERMPAALEFIRGGGGGASGAKMDAIINGLLRLSRAGRMMLRAEALDMNRLLESAAAAMAFQLQEAEGEVLLEDLPPCLGGSGAGGAGVRQSPGTTPSSTAGRGRRCASGFRPRSGDGQVVYGVEDNGIGIPVEHRAAHLRHLPAARPPGCHPGRRPGP